MSNSKLGNDTEMPKYGRGVNKYLPLMFARRYTNKLSKKQPHHLKNDPQPQTNNEQPQQPQTNNEQPQKGRKSNSNGNDTI